MYCFRKENRPSTFLQSVADNYEIVIYGTEPQIYEITCIYRYGCTKAKPMLLATA